MTFFSFRHTKLLLVLTRAEEPNERGYSSLHGAIQAYGAQVSQDCKIDKTLIAAGSLIFLDRENVKSVNC